jgi:hypothetical protein
MTNRKTPRQLAEDATTRDKESREDGSCETVLAVIAKLRDQKYKVTSHPDRDGKGSTEMEAEIGGHRLVLEETQLQDFYGQIETKRQAPIIRAMVPSLVRELEVRGIVRPVIIAVCDKGQTGALLGEDACLKIANMVAEPETCNYVALTRETSFFHEITSMPGVHLAAWDSPNEKTCLVDASPKPSRVEIAAQAFAQKSPKLNEAGKTKNRETILVLTSAGAAWHPFWQDAVDLATEPPCPAVDHIVLVTNLGDGTLEVAFLAGAYQPNQDSAVNVYLFSEGRVMPRGPGVDNV